MSRAARPTDSSDWPIKPIPASFGKAFTVACPSYTFIENKGRITVPILSRAVTALGIEMADE